MGKKVILDTNIVIGLWTNQIETFKKHPDLLKKEMCITIFTYVELIAATPERHKDKTKKFLDGFKLIPFSSSSASWAKLVSYKLVTSPAQFIDLLIFSNSKGDCTDLITDNIKDFEKFKQVRKEKK